MPGRGSIVSIGNRLCGECSSCCTHLPISAGVVSPGSKPAGVRCPHACQAGCRIYSQRPQVCADFRCAWFDDSGWPDRWRPDRVGLLCLKERLNNVVPAGLVYETRPGALDLTVADEIVSQLQQVTAIVVTVDSDQRRQRFLGAWEPREARPAAELARLARREAG